MHSSFVPLFFVALAACTPTRPPHSAPKPEPPPTVPPQVAGTEAFDLEGLAAAARRDGFEKIGIETDDEGRVERIRLFTTTRPSFVLNEAGEAKVKAFVAAHGARFGYGTLGDADFGFVVRHEPFTTAILKYPKAQKCPGLEIGLTYSTVPENKVLLGIPREWLVHCPDPDRPFITIADRSGQPGEKWGYLVASARASAKDPLVAWFRERHFPKVEQYDTLQDIIRIRFEETGTSQGDPLDVAREVAKKVIALRGLPPLDREVVTSRRSKSPDPPIDHVTLKRTVVPLDARHIDPSVVVSFTVAETQPPYRYVVSEVAIDVSEEPAGQKPPSDTARKLPSTFATSPEYLYYCNTSGGMIPTIDSFLVDRRGDVYEFVGSPIAFTEADIARALRRFKRFLGTLDPADVDTLALAISRVATAKRVGKADSIATSCQFFQKGNEGTLVRIPDFTTMGGREGSAPALAGTVLNRARTLRARERQR